MVAETPYPNAFTYTAPTTLWYAPDGLNRLASFLKRLNISRAMLVCDPGVEQAGLSAMSIAASGGRVVHTFAEVESDAPITNVEAGARAVSECNADGIVALGGGSTIDCAKAIALLARHGGDLRRWDGINRIGEPGLPLIAIPTTAGTGSEVSNIAVIKDVEQSRKLVLIDKAVYPLIAILDPRLTTGLPAIITAATGMDALTHAIEGMVSLYRNPICDGVGSESIRLIHKWLPVAVQHPENLQARSNMLLAASMAGQLVALTFGGICHAAAHALGIGCGIHHGMANALFLPWSIRFNARDPGVLALYDRAASAFGVGASENNAIALANSIEHMVQAMGLPTRLSQVGVGASDLKRLSELAFADPSHRPNPVSMAGPEVFEAAFQELL